MRDVTLWIHGMHCDGCAARLRTVLGREPGVRETDVPLAGAQARVRFNEHATSSERLVEVIEHVGFEVTERS